MKTKKLFISFAAFAAASVLMSSCSNEESTATANDQLTTFTGGIVTEVPMERVQIGTPGVTTRTSMNRSDINGDGAFFWESNDVIYVEDDGDKLYKSQNTITETKARADFLVLGSYTNKIQYDVYYCGENPGAAERKVVIANNQTQSDFNNTKHFGAVGDCGVAKAEKNTDPGKSGFKFDLEHKSSYLCFLPYFTTPEKRNTYKIKSIEITSNNNIAGTYDLSQNGLSGAGDSKTITLHVGSDGLLLADKTVATTSIKNSLYVVIAPGDHDLSVRYTVIDTNDNNKELILDKKYKSHTFGANMICNIPVNIDLTAENGGHRNTSSTSTLEEGFVSYYYSGRNYYMWDAAENYWSGHEWNSATPWQPTVKQATHDGYPKSKAADGARWYHEDDGPFEASVNPLFNKLPNACEMVWYVSMGDAHWDNTTRWSAFGKTYTGGVWLKKLSVIAEENGKQLADLKKADPDGRTLRDDNLYSSVWCKQGKPASSEISKYFFLPALGHYSDGYLQGFGSDGYYWSSSASYNMHYAPSYNLCFNGVSVSLLRFNRECGFVAQPFE